MALTDKLGAIGDAIRTASETTQTYTLDEMPAAITSIAPKIDGRSIIKSDNGQIKVSYGGSKIESIANTYQVNIPEPITNPTWNMTVPNPGINPGIVQYVMGSVDDNWFQYENVEIFDNEAGFATEVPYGDYINWIAVDGDNLLIGPGNSFEYNVSMLQSLLIMTYGGTVYETIDPNVIPIDNETITIADGVLKAAVSGGGGDAASITFDDSVAQIGVSDVQAAIEYLADEATSSTSVQEQIDTNIYNLTQKLRHWNPDRYSSTPVNASNYTWTAKGNAPYLSYAGSAIYWDLDDMEVRGAYILGSQSHFRSYNNALLYKLQKGHYYACKPLTWDEYKVYDNVLKRDYFSQEFFGLIYNISVPTGTYLVGPQPCALAYAGDTCYVFSDITHVYAAQGGGSGEGVSEDRVNELIEEALAAIGNAEEGEY